jgi:hypothetical protein
MKRIAPRLISGHALIAVSGIAYSIFWYMQEYAPGLLDGPLMLVAIVAGLAGIILMVTWEVSPDEEQAAGGPKPGIIVIITVAVFIAALAFTAIALNRPLTSELPLLMIWATAELLSLAIGRRAGLLSRLQAAIAFMTAILSISVGIACYAIHYLLNGFLQFLNGLVPYGAITAHSLLVCALLIWRVTRDTGRKDLP